MTNNHETSALPLLSRQPLFSFSHDSLMYQNQRVLDKISLRIFPGETVALIGKSGSGKSTLLKALRKQQSQGSAWCPQEHGLVPMLSTFHNIFMGGLQRHNNCYNLLNLLKPFKKNINEISLLLEKLQLDNKLSIPVAELSGGQQQRVSIGRALYQHQPVFLGDEPVSSIDAFLGNKLLALLVDQHQTVVLALHDIDQALKTCKRIIGIKDGGIALDELAEKLEPEDLTFLYD